MRKSAEECCRGGSAGRGRPQRRLHPHPAVPARRTPSVLVWNRPYTERVDNERLIGHSIISKGRRVIKKWLTVVAAALVVTAFAVLPGRADRVDAGAEPGCGMGAVCW